jgi:hypothetical protein
MLMPSDIVEYVRTVLLNARRGEWPRPNFLTTYQILERLPPALRDQLIAERTSGGRGAGVNFSAVTLVAKAAALIPGVVTEYMDCVGISVEVNGQTLSPGFDVCALFRLEA